MPQDRQKQNTDVAKLHPAIALPVAGLLVAALVMAVHWPVLSAKAIYFDDQEYLLENHLVLHPSWHSAGRFLGEVLQPTTVQGYYQPLAMISLMLDALAGGSPDKLQPFHLTSLLLHAANAVLMMVLLYAVFGHLPAAFMVAILFGLHPMTVETIAWIGERKTLLAAFFALLSLLAYVRYAGKGDEARGRVGAVLRPRASPWREGAWYAICLGCYVLALMSKPTATPLPILMLLMDMWPLGRISKRAVLEKIPFVAIAAVSSVVTIISQRRTLGATLPNEHDPLQTLLIHCHNIIFYLKHIVYPVHLSSYYPYPKPIDLSNVAILTGVIGTVMLITALLVSWRWTRALFVGWLFFFVGLLPTMGIIGFTGVVASDKYAYLPSVGLQLVLALFIKNTWSSGAINPKLRRGLIFGVLLSLACTEGVLTRQYLTRWQDTETLCRYIAEVAPDAAVPHNYLANVLFDEGQIDEAIRHFHRSIALDPDYAYSHYNLANALAKQGRSEDAIREYQEAIRLRPRLAQAYINRGAVMTQLGRLKEAADDYQEGLRIRYESPAAHYNLALVLGQLGNLPEAIEHLRVAVALKPDFAAARQALDQATTMTGRK